MTKFNWNNVRFILFALFIFYPRESSSLVPAVCSLVNCGKGTCVESSTSLLGFDCDCEPGWKKTTLGPWTFPACALPNCTVDLQCGGMSPSDQFQFTPKFDISNLCSYTYCGDGTCVSDGAGYYCKCNQGSSNLFNMAKAACFKKCNLGTDCDAAALQLPATQVPPTDHNQTSSAGAGNGNDRATQAAPANYQSGSASAGSRAVLNSWNLNIIYMALLTVVLLV